MPELHISVVGTSGDTVLSAEAISAINSAGLIVGADHQQTCIRTQVNNPDADYLDYPSPLSALEHTLKDHNGKVALLASGDPLFYGIGAWLGRHFQPEQLRFYPCVSSVQSAFARLQKPWQQAQVVSLHGRPLASLRAALSANSLYAVLTSAVNNPAAIAEELINVGFADAHCWVCEDLGLPSENVAGYSPEELARTQGFSALNVVVIETRQNSGILPCFPGIADEYFATGAEPGKGMLSKREVRLNILSLLAPQPQETGWDIGAGCGGVAVEWARWNPSGQVHAVEYHPDRLPYLEANRQQFGVVKNLNIIEGMAPGALADLPSPNAIFIGGSSGDLGAILQHSWQRLQPQGRLVCAAVTEDTRYRLYQFVDELATTANTYSVEWVEIAVAKGDQLGGRLVLRPQLPVLLLKLVKNKEPQS